jgi:hypothetical protein
MASAENQQTRNRISRSAHTELSAVAPDPIVGNAEPSHPSCDFTIRAITELSAVAPDPIVK